MIVCIHVRFFIQLARLNLLCQGRDVVTPANRPESFRGRVWVHHNGLRTPVLVPDNVAGAPVHREPHGVVVFPGKTLLERISKGILRMVHPRLVCDVGWRNHVWRQRSQIQRKAARAVRPGPDVAMRVIPVHFFRGLAEIVVGDPGNADPRCVHTRS